MAHSEVEWYNQNYIAEDENVNTKNIFQTKMVSKKFPKSLWYYGLVRHDILLSRITCREMVQTGIEEVTG